jgi:TRAP-type C4-dicarboxylate transport system permease small subunit
VSHLKKIGKIIDHLFNGLLAIALSVMCIIVFGNVVLRYLFNSGITWSEEVARYLFVWLVLLSSIMVLKDNGHLGVETVIKMLPKPLKRATYIVSNVIVLYILYLVVDGSWKMTVMNAHSYGPATGMPLSMIYGTGIVMGVGMALIAVFNLYRAVSGTVDIDILTRTQESEELLSGANSEINQQEGPR